MSDYISYTQNFQLPKPGRRTLIASVDESLRLSIGDLADKTDQGITQAMTQTLDQVASEYVSSSEARTVKISPNPYVSTQPGELLLISETPKHFTMFHDTHTGNQPVGMTDIWNTNYNRVVTIDETALGGKVLHLSASTAATRLLTIEPPSALTEPGACEMVARWKASETTAIPRLLFWGQGAPGSENGVHSVYTSSGNISIGRFNNGSAGTFGGVPKTFTPNEWHLIRARVAPASTASGVLFSVKMWAANEPEPTDWDYNASDNLQYSIQEGAPGLYFRGPGDAIVDWVGVSWETGAAPKPEVK